MLALATIALPTLTLAAANSTAVAGQRQALIDEITQRPATCADLHNRRAAGEILQSGKSWQLGYCEGLAMVALEKARAAIKAGGGRTFVDACVNIGHEHFTKGEPAKELFEEAKPSKSATLATRQAELEWRAVQAINDICEILEAEKRDSMRAAQRGR